MNVAHDSLIRSLSSISLTVSAREFERDERVDGVEGGSVEVEGIVEGLVVKREEAWEEVKREIRGSFISI